MYRHNLFFFSFSCVPLFMEVLSPLFLKTIAYVTIFKSIATWAATFCLQRLTQSVPYSRVQTIVRLPTYRIFSLCEDDKAGDCTQGLYEYCKRVGTEVDRKKIPLLHQGVKPASAAPWNQRPTTSATCLPQQLIIFLRPGHLQSAFQGKVDTLHSPGESG